MCSAKETSLKNISSELRVFQGSSFGMFKITHWHRPYLFLAEFFFRGRLVCQFGFNETKQILTKFQVDPGRSDKGNTDPLRLPYQNTRRFDVFN